jgi:hypothetical protein
MTTLKLFKQNFSCVNLKIVHFNMYDSVFVQSESQLPINDYLQKTED